MKSTCSDEQPRTPTRQWSYTGNDRVERTCVTNAKDDGRKARQPVGRRSKGPTPCSNTGSERQSHKNRRFPSSSQGMGTRKVSSFLFFSFMREHTGLALLWSCCLVRDRCATETWEGSGHCALFKARLLGFYREEYRDCRETDRRTDWCT